MLFRGHIGLPAVLMQCRAGLLHRTPTKLSRGMSSFLQRKALQSALSSVDQKIKLEDAELIDLPTLELFNPLSGKQLLPSEWESATTLNLTGFEHSDKVDPFELVNKDLSDLGKRIKELLGVDHPVLETVAKYFFDIDGGKKVRPAMVLLVSQCCNAHVLGAPLEANEALLVKQKRLAEIIEMIHTASLLHDDVIDLADTRRGVKSVNSVFGNKLAILGGDYLLARASVALARLRNVRVVELLSLIIEHLVKGEVMQMHQAIRKGSDLEEVFDVYLRKTYHKTASLMANSCQAAAVLGDYPEEIVEAAFQYGKHVGMAFQLVDDILDFQGSSDSLGKPAMNDLKQGLATAPVLFASHDHPTLLNLMARKFEAPGDVDIARKMVTESSGLMQTKALAVSHAQMALDNLAIFNDSPFKDALASLVIRVVNRSC